MVDRMAIFPVKAYEALFPVRSNPRWQPTSLENFEWIYL